jgi:hypothetical protein
MMTRAEMRAGIFAAARVAELRHLAEDTARAYDEALARSGAGEVIDMDAFYCGA